MSISDFLNKIKSHYRDIDRFTIMYSLVIIGVGISTFGLGRLSVDNNSLNDNSIAVTENNTLSNISQSNNIINDKKYVASKNGKLYYTASCSGAKRIATKNEVWFSTAIEAEKSGYSLSSSCK